MSKYSASIVIGQNIRRLRLSAGLSQEELAARVHIIDQGYISGLENGKRNPTINMLILIANSLNVEVRDLLTAERTRPSEINSLK